MLKHIIETIRGMKTKATPGKTLIATKELSPAKKQKIRKETTKPETKGRKPRKKTK
jgi:hypothetical protein